MKSPRKKLNLFLAIFILLIGVAIGGYLVLKSRAGVASQIASILNGKTNLACQPDANNPNQDSDNDGLKDWQEMQIYKTDPCKEDTDSDGYLDGEEIAAGYDPNKKAPDDKLTDQAMDPRPAKGNLTSQLANLIARKMMDGDLSAATGEIDENSVNSTVDNFLANIPTSEVPSFIVKANSISDSEIIISDNNSAEAIKQYALQLMTVYANYFSLDSAGPEENINFNIATDAIESRDFSKLDIMVKSYKNCAQDFKQLSVPSTWKNIHKKYIAVMLSSANIFEAVKLIDSDPLKVTLALQQYDDVKNMFQDIADETDKLIKK